MTIFDLIKIIPGEHLTAEYARDINRFGKVPAIHDGDLRLAEGGAIMRYVVEKYQLEDPWYPKDAKVRAPVDEYISWAHNTIRYHVAMSFFRKFRNVVMNNKQPNPEVLKKMDQNVQAVLDEFENLWMQGEYIAGDILTVADIFAACDVQQAKMTGCDPLENRPKITAWMRRVQGELEPHFTANHEGVFMVAEIVQNTKYY